MKLTTIFQRPSLSEKIEISFWKWFEQHSRCQNSSYREIICGNDLINIVVARIHDRIYHVIKSFVEMV